MSDRDFVSKATLAADPKTHGISVTYESVDDPSMPPLKKYVRGVMWCEFKMTPMSFPGQTYVEAEIHCDPKGSIAKWLVNFFQESWPQTTFNNLRHQVQKPDIQVLPVIESLLPKPGVKMAKSAR